MSRRSRAVAGAVSILIVGLWAPDALALDERHPATPVETPAPSPTPTATPAPSPAPLLPVAPSATPTPSPTPAAAEEVSVNAVDTQTLPDLRLARIADLRLLRHKSRLQLRFSSTLLNVGPHPMVVRAHRERPTRKFNIEQRVRLASGSWSFADIPLGTVYAGDGHSHQHIRNVVRYHLYRLDKTGAVDPTERRRARKIGFCIYDNVRMAGQPGQPRRPVYLRSGCGAERSLRLRMGLSPGWGDFYASTLPGQWVSLFGLPSGTYRLIGEANPEGVFYEQSTTNNGVYLDFRLRRGDNARITVLRRGFQPSEKAVANVSSHDGHSAHPDEVEQEPPVEVEPSASPPGARARPVASLAPRRRERLTTPHGLRREHP